MKRPPLGALDTDIEITAQASFDASSRAWTTCHWPHLVWIDDTSWLFEGGLTSKTANLLSVCATTQKERVLWRREALWVQSVEEDAAMAMSIGSESLEAIRQRRWKMAIYLARKSIIRGACYPIDNPWEVFAKTVERLAAMD